MLNSKVTVVIPIYNTEEYLEKCLQSIKNQTYSNLQVLMVDDASTDQSREICLKYAEADPRFELICMERNSGLCAVRNAGIRRADGEVISFVDSDDWLEADFYEKMLFEMQKHGADIVMCDFDINGSKEFNLTHQVYSDEAVLDAFARRAICNRVMNKLYRTSICKTILFPESHRIMEDMAWTAWILEKCSKLACIDYAGYHYRVRPGSLTTKKKTIDEIAMMFINCFERDRVILRHIFDGDMRFKLVREAIQHIHTVFQIGCRIKPELYLAIINFLEEHMADIHKVAKKTELETFRKMVDEPNVEKGLRIYRRAMFWSSGFADRKTKLKNAVKILLRSHQKNISIKQ